MNKLNPIGQDYEKVVLSINIAIAVFAVNFSFLQYQFLPYKSLLHSISRNHIVASVLVIVLAVFPIICLPFKQIPISAVLPIMIPIVAFASIALSVLARHEVNPKTLIQRFCSKKAMHSFLKQYSQTVKKHITDLKSSELSKPKDMPPHEWEIQPIPHSQLRNPFDFLASLGLTAIKNSDIDTYVFALDETLKTKTLILNYVFDKDKFTSLDIREVFNQHANDTIKRLATASLEIDKSDTFAAKFLGTCALFLRRLAFDSQQTSGLFFSILLQMVEVSKELLRKGNRDSSLITIVIARQAAQRGIDSPHPQNPLFDANLASLVEVIKTLGKEAIKLSNTEYLYRCLDALGWLGCSSVKKDHLEIGTACLQAIVQLGRETVPKKLECFWSHCALTPADHAFERLDWMLSWVKSLENSKREDWVKALSEAYSRLRGVEFDIKIESKNGKETIIKVESDRPFKASYIANGTFREVDYSDPDFLKDLKLY